MQPTQCVCNTPCCCCWPYVITARGATTCTLHTLFIASVRCKHYSDVLMGAMASQITKLTIVYSTVYSGTDQSSAVAGEFSAQRASNAENVSIWWRHYGTQRLLRLETTEPRWLIKSPNLGNVSHTQGEVTANLWADTHTVSGRSSLKMILPPLWHICVKRVVPLSNSR